MRKKKGLGFFENQDVCVCVCCRMIVGGYAMKTKERNQVGDTKVYKFNLSHCKSQSKGHMRATLVALVRERLLLI